ncbi:unnamed protein product [Adineta ricciae]|uniref:Uncharacterized protein n=1 Tax=Adineta ricciae TaxID=249248 RepID=A0A813Z3L9_ADIRI|nr:unnamed protein product [Adineta ricciae]CAF1490613.1 unnamed protein product [Adineta ricciae]
MDMWYWKCWTTFMLLIGTFHVVQSSSAKFTISAVGQNLIGNDENGDIPAYSLQLPINQQVTLVAQGVVMPRGKEPQASEPDVGTWLFDDSVFQLLPHDRNQFNATQIPITLKPMRSVAIDTRVRFVGNILGYDRKYDVLINMNN